jgi:L-asparaginase
MTADDRNPKENLPRVAVVATGGTIAETPNPVTGGLEPSLSGEQLVAAVPGLERLAWLESVEFSRLDSSQMTPEHWTRLSRTVQALCDRGDVHGVVVVHGTDTMEQSAFFLDLTLDTDKPVVFVGAQRGAASEDPDGPANLRNAVLQAASPKSSGLGVTVTMNQYINAARNVRKTHTDNVMCFTSGEAGFLGAVSPNRLTVYQRPVRLGRFALPDRLPDVALLATFAGDDGRFVRCAVESGVHGLVMAAFGLGNVPAGVCAALEEAVERGVTVVIASSTAGGPTYPLYGGPGGGRELARMGALFCGPNLTPPKARILLMLALGTGHAGAGLRRIFEET